MNSVFHLSASSLKPEHSGEHSKGKMPCQAVSSSPPAFHIQKLTLSSESRFSPPFLFPSRVLLVYGAQGGWMAEPVLESRLWKGLTYSLFEQCLSKTDFGKMSRILIRMTVTIVISGELMRRQLFQLLLNTLLNNSWWNLSKWLMWKHTHTCGNTGRKTHPHVALERTHRWALKLFCFHKNTIKN